MALMRTIERSLTFKKDYKKSLKGKHKKNIGKILPTVLTMLANDNILEQKYRDHELSGNWSGYRECHLKPDLLLIYCKPDKKTYLIQ